METSNKKNQFVWAQTVTVYGSKLTLHTTNFKKSWGLKFYEAFRYGKGLKLQAVNSKLPAMIKLFIGCEIITLIYSKFIKDRITITNSANSSDDIYEKNNSVISIHQKISKNFIYKFFEKENFSDYIANILIYSLFGKYFYFSNRKLTYSIFAIGGLSSIIFYKLNNIAKNFAQKKMKIQDLNLYSTQFNLIPKIFLTTSILSLFNYFFKENFYMIKNKIPMNHKMIYVYFWAYILSKVSRPISNVTHESLNLKNLEGASAWLIAALLIRPTMLPCFVLLHYFNPYSLIIWIGAKNNTEEKWVDDNYSKKSIVAKLRSYFVFVSMLSFTNMLNIYF